jgi:hypothetical protein
VDNVSGLIRVKRLILTVFSGSRHIQLPPHIQAQLACTCILYTGGQRIRGVSRRPQWITVGTNITATVTTTQQRPMADTSQRDGKNMCTAMSTRIMTSIRITMNIRMRRTLNMAERTTRTTSRRKSTK